MAMGSRTANLRCAVAWRWPAPCQPPSHGFPIN